jgi:hypothetical protein
MDSRQDPVCPHPQITRAIRPGDAHSTALNFFAFAAALVTCCAEAVEARQDKATPSKGLDSGQFRKLTCSANSTTKLIPDWATAPHRSAVVLEVGGRVRMLRGSSQLKRMRPSHRADLVVNQQHGSVFGSESILVHV